MKRDRIDALEKIRALCNDPSTHTRPIENVLSQIENICRHALEDYDPPKLDPNMVEALNIALANKQVSLFLQPDGSYTTTLRGQAWTLRAAYTWGNRIAVCVQPSDAPRLRRGMPFTDAKKAVEYMVAQTLAVQEEP